MHTSRFLLLLTMACAGTDTHTDPSDNPSDETDVATVDDEDTDDDGPVDDAEADNLASSAGDDAPDYLRDVAYDKLVVEVDFHEGRRPSAEVVAALRTVLEALCTKPGGVEIVLDDAHPVPSDTSWTAADLDAFEHDVRTRWHDPAAGVAVLHVSWVAGSSARDTETGKILGTAFHGSSLVVYPDTIEDLSGGLLGGVLQADPYSVVLQHEVGHLLGLVNNGTPMVAPHQDEAHGAHDENEDCLMFWEADGAALFDALADRAPTFDDACLDDVAAAGGRTKTEARARLEE